MTITQTVEIPADRRVYLELPSTAPSGVMARVKIDIPAVYTEEKNTSIQPFSEINEIRQLLMNEMAEKGTTAIMVDSGDGWEAYVRERHAEP